MHTVILVVGVISSLATDRPQRWMCYWMLMAMIELALPHHTLENNGLLSAVLAAALGGSDAVVAEDIALLIVPRMRVVVLWACSLMTDIRVAYMRWVLTSASHLIVNESAQDVE